VELHIDDQNEAYKRHFDSKNTVVPPHNQ
jgi:hypothetical protein